MAIQMDDEERKKELVKNFLLKKFEEKRAASDSDMKNARQNESMFGAANILGRSLTELGNSKNRDAILYNSFGNLGAAPKVLEAEDRKWDDGPLDKIGKAGVDAAKDKRKDAFEEIREGQTVREWDRDNANAPLEDAFAEEKRGQTRTEWARENKNAPLEDQFNEEKRGQSRTEWARENRNAPLEDSFAEDQRSYKRYEMGRNKKLNAFEDQDMDPNSQVSKNVGMLYKNVLLSKAAEAAKAGDQQAAADLRAMAKNTTMSAREQYDSLKMMRELDWNDILDREAAVRRAAMTRPRDINPMVQKASEKLANHQNMQEAFGIVDKALGAPLESFRSENGKVFKDGKEIDLPGVSFMGLGRITAHSEKARALNAAASRIFNTVLSDRSGAAVTNQEMERLRGEFESGRMNTEADLIRGMQDYKRAATAAMKNAEAGFSPEVLDIYRDRGGSTLRDYQAGPRTRAAPEASEPSQPKRRRATSINDL
jgi:hypothetical protein